MTTLADKYVPYGMHHLDAGYDISDPMLSSRQRSLLEFSADWFNSPSQHQKGSAVPYVSNPALTRLHPLVHQQRDGVQTLTGKQQELVSGWVGPRGSGVVPFVAAALL